MPPRTRRKAVVEPEIDDIEDLDNEEETEPKPIRRGRPRKTTTTDVTEKPARKTTPASESNGYGTGWLVEHVNETLDTSLDSKALRVILRNLTEEGIIEREDNSRYSFTGPRDKTVLAVIKAVRTAGTKTESKPATATRKKTTVAETPKPTRGRPKKKIVEPDPDLPDFPDEDDDEIEEL